MILTYFNSTEKTLNNIKATTRLMKNRPDAETDPNKVNTLEKKELNLL